MTPSWSDPVDLEPGERTLRHWPAETARADGSSDRAGWLILTNHRVLFFRRSGLFAGGRAERPPAIFRRLEEIRAVAARRFWMSIGYGDRVEVPGLAIDAQTFRLNRESSAEEVRAAVEAARVARISELRAAAER